MVTDKDITNFHNASWPPRILLCTPTTLKFQTIYHTNIVCIESHLMCGLDLLPSKFLVVLNYFSMLCECWLGIPPNTTLLVFLFFGSL
jgi:hypothetical protein